MKNFRGVKEDVLILRAAMVVNDEIRKGGSGP